MLQRMQGKYILSFPYFLTAKIEDLFNGDRAVDEFSVL
jgi:hypothetical protein